MSLTPAAAASLTTLRASTVFRSLAEVGPEFEKHVLHWKLHVELMFRKICSKGEGAIQSLSLIWPGLSLNNICAYARCSATSR